MELSEVERKIIECFKNNEPRDLSISEVARSVGINRITASKYIEVLCARGILVPTRSVGRARMFKIASEYEKAKASAELKEEKPKVKVEFIKSYLQYRVGQIVELEEEDARKFVKSGFARELRCNLE